MADHYLEHLFSPRSIALFGAQDFSWVTLEIKMIADKHAKGRIVSALEGGYTLSALGRSVAAHLDALLG